MIITILHGGGGGLPDLLQYYKGGGVSRDPQFVLRNIWTAPNIIEMGVIEVNYGAENLFSEPADARFRPQIGALKLKLLQLKNKGTMNECWLLFHRGSSVNL